MSDSFKLLEHVLMEIEENIKTDLTAESLAKTVSISSAHLQRLFKFACERPIASYIRSRKLAASLETLLKTDFKIIDIANEYGFNYEQTFIRAFRREFGITPGEARNSKNIIKVTPPIRFLKKNKTRHGVLFGPDIVMVPQFQVVGRRHIIPINERRELAPEAAKDFWFNDRETISDCIDRDNIYIGLTRPLNSFSTLYLPSVMVSSVKNIPEGLEADTFPASLCVRFHYIGRHNYFDLNIEVASAMYKAIDEYVNDEYSEYSILEERFYFEKIYKANYDGTYCQMEWFTPAIKKRKMLENVH